MYNIDLFQLFGFCTLLFNDEMYSLLKLINKNSTSHCEQNVYIY